MTESAKVVGIATGPRRRRPHGGEEELRERLRRLEEELARAREVSTRARAAEEGPLVALARLLQSGRRGINWDNVARLWSALYFAWHSEDVDEFGYDRKFT